MWKADRAGGLEELKKTLRQDHEEMWKANSVRILKEFKEKLGKDSLWDPSYDTIFEIIKNICLQNAQRLALKEMVEILSSSSSKIENWKQKWYQFYESNQSNITEYENIWQHFENSVFPSREFY
ncbi:unnamed protein product [Adineta steineri]|uniref:Uncharacterized protein n=1 Tax=Adineta steineri TaxID=433720 RepID=A0A813YUX9_9BILA|nr:unnamed protein product [Adineta steineri]CAF0890211.1 unnamed protein product [Adineta steineri]